MIVTKCTRVCSQPTSRHPVAQGLEIKNPKAAEQKVAEANAKYFGKGGFDFVNKRSKT